MGSSSKEQTVGYRYFLGAHMALCHGPADRILRIRVDSKDAWVGNREGGAIVINAPGLFGGDSREGGVTGTVDIDLGGPGQGQNSYLKSKLGDLVPAFRGITAAVLRQVYVGLNPYLKAWSFRLQRIHTRQDGLPQWYDETAEIRIDDPFRQDQMFCFILDNSGSMYLEVEPGVTRMDLLKQAMSSVLLRIDQLRIDSGVRVDILVAAFSHPTSTISRENVSSAGIQDLTNFISGLSDMGCWTNFNDGISAAVNYFNTHRFGTGGIVRKVVFITDGEPTNPTDSDDLAAITAADLLNRASGFFSDAYDTAVDMYGINIALEETRHTEKLDNTPGDGVPVIGDGSSAAIERAILFAFMGASSALNPAHIIRECLTDPDWGMGYAEADIDDTAFAAAAERLYDEGMGISIQWDRQTPLEDFINEIIRHIDGALFVDRTTGKFVLRLIRDDYDPETLPVLDESNVSRMEGFFRQIPGELTNSVTVQYWDAATGNDASLTVQDTALIQVQGATINTTVQYPGFPTRQIAARAGARDLRALSTPLATCTLYANRQAAGLRIGDPFKLSWPKLNLAGIVMRVTDIAYGDGRSNAVRIRAAQDVFAYPENGLIADPGTAWENPVGIPEAAEHRLVVEAPYYEIVQLVGQADADALLASEPELGFILAAAVRPTSGCINARIYTDSGAGYAEGDSLDFCPSAVLAADIGHTDTLISIEAGVDLDLVEVGSHAQLGDEIVRIDAVSSSSVTVGRGCLDTLPAEHSSGNRIFFWDLYAAGDGTEYTDGETVNVRILPVTGLGQLSIDSATADAATLAARAIRPYPPGDFTINGAYFPDVIDGLAGLSLAWAHRDRLQQTGGALLDFLDGDIGPEAGTTYTIRIYGDSDSLLHTYTGVSGTAQAYSIATELADGGVATEDPYWSDVMLLLNMNGDDDGTTFTDSSPTPKTILRGGDTVTKTTVKKYGTASAYFDGNGDYLTAPYTTGFDPNGNTLVVEAWIYLTTTSVSATRYIASTRGTSINGGWALLVSASRTIQIAAWNGSSTVTSPTGSTVLNTSQWYHVAYVIDGTSHRVYLDGELEISATASNTVSNSTSDVLTVGRCQNFTTRDWQGYIDDIRITNAPAARYTSDFTPPAQQLGHYIYEFRLNGRLRIELEAVRGGYTSLQKYDHAVLREGYGFNYGHYYGGLDA